MDEKKTFQSILFWWISTPRSGATKTISRIIITYPYFPLMHDVHEGEVAG